MLKISEQELGDILLGSAEIQKISKSQNFLVAREFRVDSGVPDFILISQLDYQKIIRLSSMYSPEVFRGVSSSIIAMVYGPMKIKDINTLAQAHRVSRQIIKKHVSKLEEYGIVSYDKKKELVVKNKNFKLPNVEVISLELKLDKWKKALWQASRNQAFYSTSYVVMPSNKEDLIRQNMRYFEVNDVSAAVIDLNGGSVKLVTPKRSIKKNSGEITTQRLTGISYLMQGRDSFAFL